MTLLLLLACRSPSSPDTVDTYLLIDDTGRPADTGDSGDTSETGDTGPVDTGEELPVEAIHTWPASFAAPDLRITGCGGRDDGATALASGPDLDGDGLPELLAGSSGHDGDGTDIGVVRLYRSGGLAGALDGDAAHAWAEGDAAGDGLGARVQWVGDRDGDGVDDVLATGVDQPMRLLSGAALASGGPRGVLATLDEVGGRALRWDDIDGDGVDDWLFGLPDRGLTGTGSSRGGIAAVLDAAFDASGTLTTHDVVYDADGFGLAGTALALLAEDHDRDGIREPVTNLGDDLVVVNSGTMLDWATWVDDGIRWRFPGHAGDDLLTLGDVDGGGREDVVLRGDDELCVALGEEGDATETPLGCLAWTSTAAALGEDLGGDGVPEVWTGGDGVVTALDGAALIAGILTPVATVAVDGTVATLAIDGGTLLVGLDAASTWAAATAAVIAPAADAAGVTATLVGGGTGGDPAAPTWRDLDGDGASELIFYEDSLYVFAGAGLSGGERTLCEAESSVALGADAVAWVSDRTGDGVDDLVAAGLPEAGSVALLDGAALLAGTASVSASWASVDAAMPLPGCDVDGDGLDELVAWTGGVGSRVWSGDVVGSPALLGTIDGVVESCLPDLDGDGGAELLAQGFYVYTGASLTPTDTLGWRDAWLSLPLDGAPAWRGWLGADDPDGDGVSDLAWSRVADGEPQVGSLAADALSQGADPSSAPFSAWAIGGPAYGAAWHEAVFGETADDPVWTVVDEDGSAVAAQTTDGTTIYSLVSLPTRAEGDTGTWRLGSAPDLSGVGAHAISLVWGGEDAGRPELGVVYAR